MRRQPRTQTGSGRKMGLWVLEIVSRVLSKIWWAPAAKIKSFVRFSIRTQIVLQRTTVLAILGRFVLNKCQLYCHDTSTYHGAMS
jgi:hypothetical protein